MSWKTTVCGVCGVIAAVALGIKNVLDGDPATSIDVPSIIASIAVLAPSIGAIFARDNDKSSEDVGVK